MKYKNISVLKSLILFCLVIMAVSCLAPTTKESYLEKFGKFIERVEQNHKNYNKKDWNCADSQFEKYNNNWYLKFKGEYTLNDQIIIKSLVLKYNSYKSNEDFKQILKDLFEDDVDEMKGKLENYIDKNLDEDLDKLIEGASEIGDSAVKVLEEIIEKIDNSF